MNDAERWQQANSHYLGAALTWLRLRLQRHVAPAAPEQAGAGPARVLVPEGAGTGLDEVARAALDLAEAERAGPPPALVQLARNLDLSRFEQEVLLLCVAMEFDTRIAPLCAQAPENLDRPYPTFALALALFDNPAWDVLSPDRPLRYWRLLEINQPGHQTLTTSALRADERIVNYLQGLSYVDDRLAPLLAPLDVAGVAVALPPSQAAVADAVEAGLEQAYAGRRLPVVQLLGPDGPSKQLVARAVAARFGLHLYRLPAELLPAPTADLETLARLWHRETHLAPLALYLDAHDLDRPAAGEGAPTLQTFLSRAPGVVFLDVRDAVAVPGRITAAFEVAKPTPAEQRDAWAAALGAAAGDMPELLASQFNLDPATLQRTAQGVRAAAAADAGGVADRLWEACLAVTRPRLGRLTERLDPRATWDDLVLPETEAALLRQVAAQVRRRSTVYDDWGFGRTMNRGLGISVLFAGESGTGKTMAAEVLANELRLHLYRIDLSAVVSKYIGETEKNLRRLFDAAEDGGAVLFFDEADALFGKRSEVKDSHDRYANIEINYLLQRMEAYRGLAILATNMKSALDAAFLRRLRFIIQFPFPGPEYRATIWQKVFPPEVPQPGEGLDSAWLARLNLTGGSIKNIALNAAFQAADRGTVVTMPLVLEAARTELRKLERPINEADFAWPARRGP